MHDELEVFAELADSITEKLENRCSRYSVAISELEYGDKDLPMGIIGYPAFITEDHPNPAQELKNRITSNLPVESCDHKNVCLETAADHVGLKEFTYSSIVTTLQINKNQIFNEPISHLATLILTDAAPVVEPYTVHSALEHINTFIPLDKFSSSSISHTNWSRPISQTCSIDTPDHPSNYNTGDYQQLDYFVRQTNGMSLNICNSRDSRKKELLKEQINDFINDVILKGCQLYS